MSVIREENDTLKVCLKNAEKDLTDKTKETEELHNLISKYETSTLSLRNKIETLKQNSKSKDNSAENTDLKQKLSEKMEMLTNLQLEYRHLEDKFRAYRLEHEREFQRVPYIFFW